MNAYYQILNADTFIKFISNNVTIGGGLGFSKALGHQVGPGESNWMAASYS